MSAAVTSQPDWQPIATMPDGATRLTRILDGDGERNVQRLCRQGRLFFTGERAAGDLAGIDHFASRRALERLQEAAEAGKS